MDKVPVRFTSLLSLTLMLMALALCVGSCKKYDKAVLSESLTRTDTALFHKPTLSDLKRTDSSSSLSSDQASRTASTYHEKKLVDIPLPLHSRKVVDYDDCVSATSISLTRTTTMSQKQVVDFYRCMLEQLGWCLKTSTRCPYEQVMIWEKPYKTCLISVRSPIQQPPSWLQYFKRPSSPATLLVIHTSIFSA